MGQVHLLKSKYDKTVFIYRLLVFNLSTQYELVWSDEFEGEELDLEKWTFDIGQGSWGWGNNELQYYTANPSNIKVQDGMLNITAQEGNMQMLITPLAG